MPSQRKRTLSDDPGVRRVYERAGRLEEEFLLLDLQERLDLLPPPRGWRRRKRRGRPPKKRRGGREAFGWKPMVILLLLKDRYEMTYREIAGHVHANSDLQRRLGIPRAPSHGTIQQAHRRISEAWWRRLNRMLVGDLKKGGLAGRPTSRPAWIVLDVPFRGSAPGRRSGSTGTRGAGTTASSRCSWRPGPGGRSSSTTGGSTAAASPT